MIRLLLAPMLNGEERLHFFTYAAIGVFVQMVDVGLFRQLIMRHWIAECAAVLAGSIAMLVHFLLNKYCNFRSNGRSTYEQCVTYLAVAAVWWAITLSVIAGMTRLLAMAPLEAKLMAVVINFPLSYLGQRHLTFGSGIVGGYRLWRGRRGAAFSTTADEGG